MSARRRFFIESGLLLLVLILDQFTKLWAQQRDLVVYNQGGVFGILPSGAWMIILGLILIFVMYEWWHLAHGMERWGMALLMIGGFGNVIDRAMFGAVRDFIYYPGLGVYGNVADIVLGVGVAVIAVSKLWEKQHEA